MRGPGQWPSREMTSLRGGQGRRSPGDAGERESRQNPLAGQGRGGEEGGLGDCTVEPLSEKGTLDGSS